MVTVPRVRADHAATRDAPGGPQPGLGIRLRGQELLLAAGAHDALSATLIEEAGFDVVWASGFGISAVLVALVGFGGMPFWLAVVLIGAAGATRGLVNASRDVMVRFAAPKDSVGTVFGFVTTGFNLGGMASPLIYAWLMDHGQPRMIYLIVVLFILLALVTCMTRRKPEGAPSWTR